MSVCVTNKLFQTIPPAREALWGFGQGDPGTARRFGRPQPRCGQSWVSDGASGDRVLLLRAAQQEPARETKRRQSVQGTTKVQHRTYFTTSIDQQWHITAVKRCIGPFNFLECLLPCTFPDGIVVYRKERELFDVEQQIVQCQNANEAKMNDLSPEDKQQYLELQASLDRILWIFHYALQCSDDWLVKSARLQITNGCRRRRTANCKQRSLHSKSH